MAYIGQSIKNGTFTVLDTSGNTYNGSNTAFALGTQVGSPAQLLVSHDGVIQKPGTDYTLSSGGAAITFSTAPASGAAIFIVEISGAVGGPMNTDINGAEFILDVDGDTSITADTDDQIDFKVGGSDKYTMTSDTFTARNNVTALSSTTDANIRVQNSTTGSGSSDGLLIQATGNDVYVNNYENADMYFRTNNTDRLKIDSSGNVLFNTADATLGDTSDNGVVLTVTGEVTAARAGNVCLLNRLTSDGSAIEVRHDGSVAGNIGNFGASNMVMGSGICGIRYNGSNLTPFRIDTYANTDDALSLGHPSIRWDNIYATNGTVNTSDQNEKQSIQLLTTTEIAVAKRISKLFKTFKFNSAVEKKGANARTHTGIIAQDVQQAFTDEGLDASNYGLFTSDTWWEKEISVDAVAEELDKNGNVLVEGKDAHTYLDTKEEVTEGYAEKTRLGIRYPELLCFISNCFEKRLTDIETRLTTLEG